LEAQTLELVFPNNTNHLGNLFGGALMAWMDKVGGFAAMRRAHSTVATVSMDHIEFKTPIKEGDLVELVGRVEQVGRTSLTVRVEASREDLMSGSRELCSIGHFTFVALDEDGRPKPVPES
jgi:acyl-CoA hydrolase